MYFRRSRTAAAALLTVVVSTPAVSTEPEAADQSIVPNCSTIESDSTIGNNIYLDRVVCGNDDLLGKLK